MTTAARDAELLARVVGGDRAAFDDIMRHHEDRIFSVCLRIMGNRELALDATQEAFLTVFRKADQFKGQAALGTWIYRIAVNTCYDQLRRQQRRKTTALGEQVDLADRRADDAMESAGLRRDIEMALATLTPEFRAAVILSDIEGLGLPEIAEILGVPIGTVKSRVFRARRLLAQALGNRNS